MRHDHRFSTAGRSYAAAHEAHYRSKNLRQALELYADIVAAHPETQEAGYSRSQIQNIAKAVVPGQELLAAELALTLSHLGATDSARPTGASAELISSG